MEPNIPDAMGNRFHTVCVSSNVGEYAEDLSGPQLP
jgi:hypothetical protein